MEGKTQLHVIRDGRYDEGQLGAWEAHVYEDKTLIVSEIFGKTRDDAITGARARYARYLENGERTEEWIDL